MAEPVPFPPPGFDELSGDEKIEYLQSLRDRIAATPETIPVPGWHGEILEERPNDLHADPNDRERLIRDQAAIDARLRLAAIVDSSDDAIVVKNLDGLIQSWNPAAEHIFGFTAAEAIGQPVTMLIPWERREEENQILEKVKHGEQVHLETIRVTKTGKRIDAFVTVTPLMDAAGRLVGATKLLRDISDQKRAHEALSRLSRKLIAAQEEERARIARELHDDIAQRLAVLAIGLTRIAEGSPGSLEVSSRAIELERLAVEIATDVQALSHKLHSSKIALLGMAASVRLFCDEFSKQQKVRIAFETNDLTSQLPSAVSLTLFRILQEALHNSVKHGEARHCGVRLWETDGWIHLVVEDDGAGFDVEATKRGHGIGLISMEERISLVDGVLSIRSQPQYGTNIYARVPLVQDEAEDVS
jgi:PAS domain S-box-containing protein